MIVPVMQIGVVRVLVAHRAVVMPVRVGLPRRVVGAMSVLMMQVMEVGVLVIQLLMGVLVRMLFRQMQVEA